MTSDNLPGPTVSVDVPDERHAWNWEPVWDFDNDRFYGLTDGEDNPPFSEFETFDDLVEAGGERLEELLGAWLKLRCWRADDVRLWFDPDSKGRHRPVLIVDGREVDMEDGRFTPPNAPPNAYVVTSEDVGAPGAETIYRKVEDFLQQSEFFEGDPMEIVVSRLDLVVAARAIERLAQRKGSETNVTANNHVAQHIARADQVARAIAHEFAPKLSMRAYLRRLPRLTPDDREDFVAAAARMRDWGLLDRDTMQSHVDVVFQKAAQGRGTLAAPVDQWIPVLGGLTGIDLYRPDPEQVAALLAHDKAEVREATLHHLVSHLDAGALDEHIEAGEARPSSAVRR